MNINSLKVRNYIQTDFNDFVNLYCKAYHINPENREVISKILRVKLSKPGCSKEKDMLFAEWRGQLVGWIIISPEKKIRRAVMELFVLPEFRNKGIGTKLLHGALIRVQEIKTEYVYAHSKENRKSQKFLERFEFKPVRTLLDMKIRTNHVKFEKVSEDDVTIDNMKPGNEALLADIQNRCFENTWGFCPNSAEEIQYYFELLGNRFHDVLFIKEKAQICGYCWTHMYVDFQKGKANKIGRIHMIGILPEHRNKGLGRKLLLAGVSHLRNKNIKKIVLAVDQQNVSALKLYQSFGFKIHSKSYWFELLNYD